MTYAVKEAYYTLQGEGANAGRAAVFLRFAGCNLWTGRAEDRANAVCKFCDTDFRGVDGPGGGHFSDPNQLASHVTRIWSPKWEADQRKLVVCTGGEPLLQLDAPLVRALKTAGFEVAVETNGTIPLVEGLNWVCVSPKAGSDLVVRSGNELKLVYPQDNALPEKFEKLAFDNFFFQPMDGTQKEANVASAVAYCLSNPLWRLSLQTHKLIGIP